MKHALLLSVRLLLLAVALYAVSNALKEMLAEQRQGDRRAVPRVAQEGTAAEGATESASLGGGRVSTSGGG